MVHFSLVVNFAVIQSEYNGFCHSL